jgi:predicted dehydrogenase
MAPERIRIGFVGAGFMGQLAHLRHYAAIESCEVVALAEPRQATGRLVADRYAIPHLYGDARTMLAEQELDGVLAIQHYGHHVQVLPDLYPHVAHVFTEKPLANTLAGGRALATAARDAGVTHMVGYQKRCDPAVVAAKEAIERWVATGEAGALRYVRVAVAAGDWLLGTDTAHADAGDPRPCTPLEAHPDVVPEDLHPAYDDLVNFFVHQLNLIRHLAGEPYALTHAAASGVLLAGETASGVPVVLEAAPYTPRGWEETVLVAFEHGTIRIALPAPLAWRPGRVEITGPDGVAQTPWLDETTCALRKQAEAFVAVCRDAQAPPADIAEALLDLELVDAAIRLMADTRTPARA